MVAQSWRTEAKWARPVRLAVMKSAAVVPVWRTSLSRKTRWLDAEPVYVMFMPGFASQVVCISSTLCTAGSLWSVEDVWGRVVCRAFRVLAGGQ